MATCATMSRRWIARCFVPGVADSFMASDTLTRVACNAGDMPKSKLVAIENGTVSATVCHDRNPRLSLVQGSLGFIFQSTWLTCKV